MITNDAYLQHISRYIHLNPKEYKHWPYSSLPYYLNNQHAEWCNPERILELFDNSADYLDFVEDYEDYKAMLDEIKHDLANH